MSGVCPRPGLRFRLPGLHEGRPDGAVGRGERVKGAWDAEPGPPQPTQEGSGPLEPGWRRGTPLLPEASRS